MSLRDLLTNAFKKQPQTSGFDFQLGNNLWANQATRTLPSGETYETVTTNPGAQPEKPRPKLSERIASTAKNLALDKVTGSPIVSAGIKYGAPALSNFLFNRESNQQQVPQQQVPQQPLQNETTPVQDPWGNFDASSYSVSDDPWGDSTMGGGFDASSMTVDDLANMTPEQIFNLRQSLAYDANAQMVGDESTPIDMMYRRANAIAGISDDSGRNFGQYQGLENTVGNIYRPQIDRLDNVLEDRMSNSSSGASLSGTPYDGVIQTLIATGKYTKAQAEQIRSAMSSGGDPKVIISQLAKANLQTTDKNLLQNTESALSEIQNVQNLLQAYYDRGGKTSWLKGNYENAIQRIGKTSDPELASVGGELIAAIMKFRNATTGTAASIQEDRRIDRIFPGIDKGEGLNNALTQGRINTLRKEVNRLYTSSLGVDYDTLFSGVSQPQQSQQSFGGSSMGGNQGGGVVQTSVGAINTNW